LICLNTEADAVRPPLKPLNSEQLQKMITDADVIATGKVIRVDLSKSIHSQLETVIMIVTMIPEKILKGKVLTESITIVESYQQFPKDEDVPDSNPTAEHIITSHTAGPSPPVGMYQDGDRILVFLKSIDGANQYRPLGSGDYDAYLGVFQITPNGVKFNRYKFDDSLAGYAKSETDFLSFIILLGKGEQQ
jgi:hypothetical protein